MAKYRHVVTEEEAGLTVNQILKANYRFSSRFKTKMKYQGLVDLDGVPSPGYLKPAPGSVIEVRLPDESSDFPPQDIPIDILYEDDDLLILNKQPGITVHPTKGHPDNTLANGITKYMLDTGKHFKVRFANRLDTDTSGIVIVAKSGNVQNDISAQMRRHSIQKKYIALAHGNITPDDFEIDLPIGRPVDERVERAVMPVGGKEARTGVHVLEHFGDDYTLVELTLHTGRTHQIRVHLSHIGHPIVGDTLYGGAAPDLMKRQALHACHIAFKHPMTGEPLVISCGLPEDIRTALSSLRESPSRPQI
ncbi:MAG: RluA family pseudouridine synthase [Mogibacterium sp.]|nr:RluA family pseudouridine synthase [Mogibacterium sp.]